MMKICNFFRQDWFRSTENLLDIFESHWLPGLLVDFRVAIFHAGLKNI